MNIMPQMNMVQPEDGAELFIERICDDCILGDDCAVDPNECQIVKRAFAMVEAEEMRLQERFWTPKKVKQLNKLNELKEIILDVISIPCGDIDCNECPFNNLGEDRNKIREKYGWACGVVAVRSVGRVYLKNYAEMPIKE